MPTPVETLVYWCRERESIRLKKLAGEPGPWTDDKILQTYRFCNVWRREDRVSKWLCENVLTEANIEYDLRSFLMFSAWCRMVNWPPTIQAAMEEGFYPKKRIDWKKLGKFVDILGKKQKVWTGAYLIRAPKKAGAKKGKFVSEVVIGTNFKQILPALVKQIKPQPGGQASYYSVWETLRTVNGFGSFYSGQIVGDWTYTLLLDEAKDLTTFAPMGPGSVRGFNRLMGITPITKRPSWDLWSEKLADWRELVVSALSREFPEQGSLYQSMDMLSVQNILCECDKYLRVVNNEGRPRARYSPHTY
jgi:5-hmdU DNA kinase-like protein